MPDYGPTPKITRGANFGISELLPRIKEEAVNVQSYNEARIMIDVGLWAGKIADKQAMEMGKKKGLKGMPLTRFAFELSNQAANDAMEWVKEEFATWGLRQLILDKGLK